MDRSRLRWLSLNGDSPDDAAILTNPTDSRLKGIIAGFDGCFIDEAQRIPEIGLTLKRLHDGFPNLKLLVTGSSSLEIGDSMREPLTGRTMTSILFPVAVMELVQTQNQLEVDKQLNDLLVLGAYPALFSIPNRKDKILLLKELSEAYLYRDILDLAGIRNPRKIRDLLRLLAWQTGSEVSFSELGTRCGLSTDTVISYIDLLEKSFVLFRMEAWNKNLRKEISRKNKIYFVDNGIRNALIDDFKEIPFRNDAGILWENWLMSERRKKNSYTGFYGSSRFWRLQTGAEIDYIEDSDGYLAAFEFKWGTKKAPVPSSFAAAYPDHKYQVINQENWRDFLVPPG